MIRIGLLSDTHGALPDGAFQFLEHCNEIWHAGDIGNAQVIHQLDKFKPLRAVYGNIDGKDIRLQFPLINIFMVEDVKVVMIHIGGYPGRYTHEARAAILKEKPKLFISGHSHILKIMYDKRNKLLHMNPGAAGKFGIHQKITMVRFVIDKNNITEVEVFEKDRYKTGGLP
nr:metallophosphoesterase family protein [Bacteroidota bacterium]